MRVKDVIEKLDEWTARGERVAHRHRGRVNAVGSAAPRGEDGHERAGEVVGAVSGGCVEGAVVEVAEEILRGGDAAAAALRDRRLRRLGRRAALRRRDRRLRGGVRAVSAAGAASRSSRARAVGRALVTVVALEAGLAAWARKLLVDGRRGPRRARSATPRPGRRRARTTAEELMWAERSELRDEGEAGAVRRRDRSRAAPAHLRRRRLRRRAVPARPGVPAGAPYVIDPRSRFATRERFPEAEEVVAAWPADAFAQARRHRPRDLPRRADPRPEARRRRAGRRPALAGAAYIGAMGSRRARRRSGASGCWPPGIADEELERTGRADRARPRSARRPRRRRCRSWPRSWRCATAARAGACPPPGPAGSTRSGPDALIAGAILAAGEGRRFGGPSRSPRSRAARCWSTRSAR